MKLFELFDKPATEWKWTAPLSNLETEAYFDLDGQTYRVDFHGMDPLDLIGDLMDENPDTDIPPELSKMEDEDAAVMDVSFYLEGSNKRSTWMITGTGNAYQVFATVFAILVEYMDHNKSMIDYLHLSATEPSRIKLYDRIVSRSKHKAFTFDAAGTKHYLVKLK